MKRYGKARGPRAFTLIELLVVMGILGLLFAILMPGIGAVRQAANRNQSRQEISSIENAIHAFFADYRRFPLQRTNEDGTIGPLNLPAARDSENTYGPRTDLRPAQGNATQVRGYVDLIRSLRGLNDDDNPRRTVYLNITDRSLLRDQHTGVTTPPDDAQLVDPWLNRYAVVANWNMDGILETMIHGNLTNRTIAVWSWNRGGYADLNDQDKHLKSWSN